MGASTSFRSSSAAMPSVAGQCQRRGQARCRAGCPAGRVYWSVPPELPIQVEVIVQDDAAGIGGHLAVHQGAWTLDGLAGPFERDGQRVAPTAPAGQEASEQGVPGANGATGMFHE